VNLPEAAWVEADWPAPSRVRALTTLRHGPDGKELDLGRGDGTRDSGPTRARLARSLALRAEPCWLRQRHGTRVVHAAQAGREPEADACVATSAGQVCVVLTADCLPVVLCDRQGTCVAAVHAGWRGLAAGVLEATVAALPVAPGTLMAWLGPGIGPDAYEVGDEVREAFAQHHEQALTAFRPSPAGRWLADLYTLARQRLASADVTESHGGGLCTFEDPARFFSHRRSADTGRMATLVWMEPGAGGSGNAPGYP
jgi:YfiH family protein